MLLCPKFGLQTNRIRDPVFRLLPSSPCHSESKCTYIVGSQQWTRFEQFETKFILVLYWLWLRDVLPKRFDSNRLSGSETFGFQTLDAHQRSSSLEMWSSFSVSLAPNSRHSRPQSGVRWLEWLHISQIRWESFFMSDAALASSQAASFVPLRAVCYFRAFSCIKRIF